MTSGPRFGNYGNSAAKATRNEYRSDRRSTRNTCDAKHVELKRFVGYSAYAFGAPILTALAIVGLNHSSLIKEEHKLRIEPLTCWLKDKETEFIYVNIPIGCILIFNIVFYCITAYKIFKAQKESKAVMRHESKRHSRSSDQNRL